MRHKTEYEIKFVVERSGTTDKQSRTFRTIKNVRKFAAKYQQSEMLYCHRHRSATNKDVDYNDFYQYDSTDPKGERRLGVWL